MRALGLGLVLLAGCDLVFQLEIPLDGPPAEGCLGRHGASGAGLFAHCTPDPGADFIAGATIRTGDVRADDHDCTLVVEQDDLMRTEACLIVARDITIPGGTVAVGQRPLVLVATRDLLVTGTLSASSRRQQLLAGAGAGLASCPGGLDGASTQLANGGAGGAGGSFALPGGNGGIGAGGTSIGLAKPETTPLGFVRGGCEGGAGGTNATSVPMGGGRRGRSGGGLYLIAGGAITVAGTLEASGEGGGGGEHGISGVGGGAGGGGGGSGGLIGLDAPRIILLASAKLIANGGGGGGGGPSTTADGAAGGEADPTSLPPFVARGGSTNGGGNGGDGGNADAVAGTGADFTAGGGGGGGGGGGAGHLRLYAPTIDDQGAQASPALVR